MRKQKYDKMKSFVQGPQTGEGGAGKLWLHFEHHVPQKKDFPLRLNEAPSCHQETLPRLCSDRRRCCGELAVMSW